MKKFWRLTDKRLSLQSLSRFGSETGGEKNLEKDLRDSKISLTFVVPFATKRETFLNWFFELLVIFERRM